MLVHDNPTCSDVIRRAARKLGIVAGGQMTVGPDTEDMLELLQSLVLGQPGELLRGRFCDIEVTADYAAQVSQRVWPMGPNLTVTLPRAGPVHIRPRDLSRVQIMPFADDPEASPENAGLWLYVASAGRWKQADGLAVGSDFPFGMEDVEGMACQLAVTAFGEFGAATQPSERDIATSRVSAASTRSRFMRAQPFDPSRPRDYPPAVGFADYR